jgi:ubiquinol-cytochrome c reductase cytochrome c1 subunit
MTKPALIQRAAAFLLALLPSAALWPDAAQAAAGDVKLQPAHVNLTDRASLQRGAALFMNYCAACHSLGFQRYSRLAEDLGLTEEQVTENLIFTGSRFGETIRTALDKDDGEAWFGKAPPDLSLVARAKLGGADWVYTFIKGFYVDETRPVGWNNTVLPNASMPNVLWELQGSHRAVYVTDADGSTRVERLERAGDGRLGDQDFDRVARDITNFLAYVAEPAALKRSFLGVWVILFLTAFTFLAWLLKKEYWRDVH